VSDDAPDDERSRTTTHVIAGGWASIVRRQLEIIQARSESRDGKMFNDEAFEIVVTVTERRKT